MSFFHKGAFTVALGLIAATFAAAFASKHFIEKARIEETFVRQQSAVLKSAARFLRPEDFRAPLAAPAQRQLRSFVQDMSAEDVVRIVVWSRDQRVISSDLPSLTGKRAPDRRALTKAFKEGLAFFEPRDQDSQSPILATTRDFLDIYVPIRLGGSTSSIVGAVEIYLDRRALLAPVQQQSQFTMIALALSGVFGLGLVLIVRTSLAKAANERAHRERVQTLVGELPQNILKLECADLTRKIQDQARAALDVDVVEIEAWDKEQINALANADGEKLKPSKRVTPDGEWIFKHRQPLVLKNIGASTEEAAPVQLGRRGVKGCLALPILTGDGEIIGILRVLSRSTGDLSGELGLLQQVANGVAIALTRAGLQEQNRQQALKLDIAEQKLADQVTELQRSNYEIEQLAHALSRDLQEPLRVVASSINQLAKSHAPKLDATGQEFIHHTLDGAKRMHTWISDVLGYARVATTQGRTFARVDSNAVLAKTLERLRDVMREKGAVVTHDKLPVVEADETQLGQLLENLLRNAIKYCDSGVPRVHVSCAKDYGFWTFKIKDNGVGIEPEFTDRIFAIFERLHTKQAVPGTGMGLSVCKKIVEGHGGKIWVDSQPNAGSTFSFTLPFKPATKLKPGVIAQGSDGLHAER